MREPGAVREPPDRAGRVVIWTALFVRAHQAPLGARGTDAGTPIGNESPAFAVRSTGSPHASLAAPGSAANKIGFGLSDRTAWGIVGVSLRTRDEARQGWAPDP